MVWAKNCFLTHFNIFRTFCGICLRATQGYSCQILALFIPREEAKKISNSSRRMRGNCERKKLKILLVSKLELKHIILYFKFWLLKTSIRGNFNYKYFHPSFSKYPFSKIKSSIASSLSKDLFWE